jgi:predicted dehydrogenase
MRILVVGCGSIGQRHIHNLIRIGGNDIAVCDSNKELLSTVTLALKIKDKFASLDDALKQQFDAVTVCTPSAFHVPAALAAVQKGYPVFIEKPLSNSLTGVQELLQAADKSKIPVMVGFNLRFHPCLQKIKQFLNENKIGKKINIRVQVGQFLPDWHPTQDYRKSYSAQKALGGGIILDAVHEIDYVRWFMGEVEQIFCYAGKLSNLEIDTEDNAEILLKFKSQAIGEIHMDYIQRSYNRSCEIIGDEGTITWNFNDNFVRIFTVPDKTWHVYLASSGEKFDFNETYINEMKCFLDCVNGHAWPPVDGQEGKRNLEIALAAKASAEKETAIKVSKLL